MNRTAMALVTMALWAAILSSGTSQTAAQADPYEADPLSLIAHFEETGAHTIGDDRWEVWVCRITEAEAEADLTPEHAAGYLNRELGPYFEWLSVSRYRIEFIVGGTVSAPYGSWPASQQPCVIRALEDSGTNTDADVAPDGMLVIVDDAHTGGYTCDRCYLGFDRVAVVGGATIEAEPGDDVTGKPEPSVGTIMHEIAHNLWFPHSFSGNTYDDNDVFEHDNPMDIMSAGTYSTGTPTVNRYAAGWVDPSEVAIHDVAVRAYELSPSAGTGTKMLVIPLGEPGWFVTLGTRVRSGADTVILAEGVEMYLIDQRAGACGPDPVSEAVCWGRNRRTRPIPHSGSTSETENSEVTEHVLDVGDIVGLNEITVQVTQRAGDTFHLVVYAGNRFVDDDGSVHADSIEAVAHAGITLGCNPPLNDEFCPHRPVTRAQMAAMLVRALPDIDPISDPTDTFSDVPTDAWYAGAVEALHTAGVVAGRTDGTYQPKQPVTRAQMASLLARALADIDPISDPTDTFSDVPTDAWYAGAVEALHTAGVVAGRTDGTYQPKQPVTRAQMASLLARALDLVPPAEDPSVVNALAEDRMPGPTDGSDSNVSSG